MSVVKDTIKLNKTLILINGEQIINLVKEDFKMWKRRTDNCKVREGGHEERYSRNREQVDR